MLSRATIQKIVNQYYIKNRRENIKSQLNKLIKLSESSISRKNFYGHITASAIVLDSSLSKILLIKHKKLSKLIQPGGHVDRADKDFRQAAIRELKEETGFTDIMEVSLDSTQPNIPLDIDIHIIPENQKKQEPEHLHFDFRYVFVLTSNQEVVGNEKEVNGIIWKSVKELEHRSADLARVAKKMRSLIFEHRDEIFFNRIINTPPSLSEINIVMVSHIVPDILPFIKSLQKISRRLCIIPKPNSIYDEILEKIPKELIRTLNRNELKTKIVFQDLFPKNMKSCIIDIGGYFATKEFFNFSNTQKNILGIIEDTENGQQKYEKLGKVTSLPVVSVARSELKQNEDDLVGYSVAYYAEMIMRRSRRLPRYLTVAIIGYGKLGRGVAKYFFNQNIKPLVYDKNPIRLVEAYKDGCIPVDKENLLSSSDLILCATGSQSISGNDFIALRPGCYIASVTSSEDEFDLSAATKIFEIKSEIEFVKKFSNTDTHWFLINNGNAVNFIDKKGDRVGDFIRLVQGEIIMGLSNILNRNFKTGLQEVSQKDKKHIAQVFLENYLPNT